MDNKVKKQMETIIKCKCGKHHGEEALCYGFKCTCGNNREFTIKNINITSSPEKEHIRTEEINELERRIAMPIMR